MNEKKLRNILRVLTYILVCIVILAFFLPVYWILTTALKSGSDVFVHHPFFRPTVSNFRNVLSEASFRKYYLNSLAAAGVSTLASLILGFPAAYALARFPFRGRNNLSFWILSLRMMPPIVVAIPFFLMFRRIGLFDTLTGLILAYTNFNLPFVIWVLRGFVEEVPPELEEAAMIDGCSRLKVLRFVTVPLLTTGIATIATLCFIFTWNEFLFALVLTGINRRTVTVAVYSFIGFAEISWGSMCAASLLASAPIVLFGVLVRKHLVSGLTLGALKE